MSHWAQCMAPPFYPWFDLERDWEWMVDLGKKRDAKSMTARNTVDMTGLRTKGISMNFPGVAGEFTYELLTGIPMNRTEEIWHDQVGEDFPFVDVKCSTYIRVPELNGNGKLKAALYFGVVLDLERKVSQPLGYATRERLAAARKRNFGHGLHPVMPAHDLWSGDHLLGRILREMREAGRELRIAE